MAGAVNINPDVHVQQQNQQQDEIAAKKKQELRKKILKLAADVVITVGAVYAAANGQPYVAALQPVAQEAAHTSTDETC